MATTCAGRPTKSNIQMHMEFPAYLTAHIDSLYIHSNSGTNFGWWRAEKFAEARILWQRSEKTSNLSAHAQIHTTGFIPAPSSCHTVVNIYDIMVELCVLVHNKNIKMKCTYHDRSFEIKHKPQTKTENKNGNKPNTHWYSMKKPPLHLFDSARFNQRRSRVSEECVNIFKTGPVILVRLLDIL